MTTFELSEDTYRRIEEFRSVINAVVEDELDMEDCLAIIERGLDSMLRDVLSPLERDVLLEALRQLAAREPAAVYRYMSDTLNRCTQLNKGTLRPRIAFTELTSSYRDISHIA